MRVPLRDAGKYLHLMEWSADVFLIDRVPDENDGCEWWWMNSDRFPDYWAGRFVEPVTHERGLSFELTRFS